MSPPPNFSQSEDALTEIQQEGTLNKVNIQNVNQSNQISKMEKKIKEKEEVISLLLSVNRMSEKEKKQLKIYLKERETVL